MVFPDLSPFGLVDPVLISPVYRRAEGIDISHWDGMLKPTVRCEFVIQKVSDGLAMDALADANYSAMLRVGVRAAYHYLRSGYGWKAQADRFINIVSGKDYHFFVCDFENTNNTVDKTYAAMCYEWCNYVEAQTKKRVLVYTSVGLYNEFLGLDSRMERFGLWLAWYAIPQHTPTQAQTAEPIMPYRRKNNWLFWQYSAGEHNSLGSVYGVDARGVDANVFNGSAAELYAWAGVMPQPIPTPQSDPDSIPANALEILWRDYQERMR